MLCVLLMQYDDDEKRIRRKKNRKEVLQKGETRFYVILFFLGIYELFVCQSNRIQIITYTHTK